MKKCPTCNSPEPHLHPSVQIEGEVFVCHNEFHEQETPQNRPEYIELVKQRRAALFGEETDQMTPNASKGIEALAQATYEADGGNWDDLLDAWKDVIRDRARKVVAGMDSIGVVCVPREPTDAMLRAGQKAWLDDPCRRSSTLYRAMVAQFEGDRDE